MSGEVEQELEQSLKEIRKIMDENFKPLMGIGNWLVESTEKASEIAKEVEHMFKYRSGDVTSAKDLEVITAFNAMLTNRLLELAKLQCKMLVELKEASICALYVPIYATWKFSERTLPFVGERLVAFEKEIQRLKKSRENIEIEVPKEYEEAMKELTRQIEERKRKQKEMLA